MIVSIGSRCQTPVPLPFRGPAGESLRRRRAVGAVLLRIAAQQGLAILSGGAPPPGGTRRVRAASQPPGRGSGIDQVDVLAAARTGGLYQVVRPLEARLAGQSP